MANKLIVLMLDGISADYFATCRARLPHLAALAERGFEIQNLRSEVCGTSLPGRTSMMTGERADVSGVYGNMIWGGEQFRYATPYDVRVPTLAGRARAAGRSVAVVGFGMLRPEDADLFMMPWWAGLFIQRARDNAPVEAGEGWMKVFQHPGNRERFAQIVGTADLPTEWPSVESASGADRMALSMMADRRTVDWVSALATSDDSPDVIIAETLITDSVQHYTGYKSEYAHWSVAYADMLVGVVIERLRAAGKLDSYNIAVMSDHGHSPIDTAIHPSVIIPDATFQSEGSILHVVPKDAAELAQITEALAPYGVTPYTNTHIPTDHRDQIAAFVAPDRTSFEHDPNKEIDGPTGTPAALSSHGLRPGSPGDDRFAVFVGPDVKPGVLERAEAAQVAPTLAQLAGIALDSYPMPPAFTQ
ncbi:MAG: alkaline phosphatase family protein [Chloroflexi bacterium]|nr:alkaline phosphatase family protein [Chloroflexota bacterium]